MKRGWSNPVAYDLTRTLRRASVPKAFEHAVPEMPGIYVIYRLGQNNATEAILDIGECGPRPNSSRKGLRGRLASGVAHSASERIAQDVLSGVLTDDLFVVWREAESKNLAKDTQDALISLFRRDYGRQPRYNTKLEYHAHPEIFESIYTEVMALIGCSA